MSAPKAPTARTASTAPNAPAGAPGAPARAARAGFTTLELLVVMAIVGILAGLGWVNLPRDRFAAREAARVLAADVNRARSEAVRLNTNVALQFGGIDCGDYCLYADPGRSGTPTADLDGDGVADMASPMLQRRSFVGDFPRVDMTTSGFGASNTVWFDVRGLPRAQTGTYMSGTASVAFRPTGAAEGFVVTLEPQGRVQVATE